LIDFKIKAVYDKEKHLARNTNFQNFFSAGKKALPLKNKKNVGSLFQVLESFRIKLSTKILS
jgi:hypothetical protein